MENDNKIMEQFLALQDTLKEREAEIESYKSQIEDFKTKQDDYINQVSSLRDTNQKLFLRVSQPQQEPETVKAEPIVEESVVSWNDIAALF